MKPFRLEAVMSRLEEIDEIEVKQLTDRQEALDNEKNTINKRVEENAGKSRRDRSSRL